MTDTTDAVATQSPSVTESATAGRLEAVAFGYDPDRDFRKLALEASYFSKGFRLVEKEDMIGVPHVIIGVTYREGFPREGNVKNPGDYVSIEAVVADKYTLASNPVKHMLPGELTVYPNESVVYNDSGTGIRRDLTNLMHRIGVIDVGPAGTDENEFDRQFQVWAAGADRAQNGIVADLDGVAFRYVAMRGLRKSEYESPYGPATTFYFG